MNVRSIKKRSSRPRVTKGKKLDLLSKVSVNGQKEAQHVELPPYLSDEWALGFSAYLHRIGKAYPAPDVYTVTWKRMLQVTRCSNVAPLRVIILESFPLTERAFRTFELTRNERKC